MSLDEAETSWAEVPKGRSDLGPKWKKAEVTGYPAEYYGFAIFHIMIYIYFIAALSHRQRLNSYYIYIIFMCLDFVLSIVIMEMAVFLLKIQRYAQ